MKFSIKDFFSKCDQITFTEEILKWKTSFLCSANWRPVLTGHLFGLGSLQEVFPRTGSLIEPCAFNRSFTVFP